MSCSCSCGWVKVSVTTTRREGGAHICGFEEVDSTGAPVSDPTTTWYKQRLVNGGSPGTPMLTTITSPSDLVNPTAYGAPASCESITFSTTAGGSGDGTIENAGDSASAADVHAAAVDYATSTAAPSEVEVVMTQMETEFGLQDQGYRSTWYEMAGGVLQQPEAVAEDSGPGGIVVYRESDVVFKRIGSLVPVRVRYEIQQFLAGVPVGAPVAGSELIPSAAEESEVVEVRAIGYPTADTAELVVVGIDVPAL
jgi:hypothetical protein